MYQNTRKLKKLTQRTNRNVKTKTLLIFFMERVLSQYTVTNEVRVIEGRGPTI